MAKSGSRSVVVDSRFYLPPDIVDARQESDENGDIYYNDEAQAVDGPVLDTPTSGIPNPPGNFTIVSQTVRMGSDGRSVVDVIFEFPDVTGIEYINPRVTKL